MSLGPILQGHLGQLGGQQAGVQDGGEAVGGALAVLALTAGDPGKELGDGVGGGVRCRVRGGGQGEGLSIRATVPGPRTPQGEAASIPV
ncbi:hypothetical protein ACFWSF_38150 [Streptomyces sp. NPDC058611]|uniref:hypothetical protein n=1 Tax=unclassified Streptomyces TaxID=2593676 RepID=UPI003656A5C6